LEETREIIIFANDNYDLEAMDFVSQLPKSAVIAPPYASIAAISKTAFSSHGTD